jgi:hypothetical protein
MVGRLMAASTRGFTSEGPGPIRVRTGGWKDLKDMVSPEVEIGKIPD